MMDKRQVISKLKSIAEGKVCFLGTHHEPYRMAVRPMMTLRVDEDGVFWFFIKEDHDAVRQIQAYEQVDLLYQDSSEETYLALRGEASVYRNQNVIDELYSSWANAWFDGKDDPSLHILRVEPQEVHYWTNENGKVATLFKVAYAAMTNEKASVGKEVNYQFS